MPQRIVYINGRLQYDQRAEQQLLSAVDAINNGDVAGIIKDDLSKRSADSAAMLPYWDKSDDFIDGYDAVKKAGPKYLPKFTDENPDDYNERLDQTKLTNVYSDVVENLSSKPFEEEVSLVEGEGKTIPEEIETFIEDVDGAGNNMTMFAANVFFNGINSAIHWVFVDHPKVDEAIVTRADAKNAGIRPFWSHILGRNVLEARSKVIGGKETLIYIRILEPGKPNHIRIFDRNLDTNQVLWGLFEEKIEGSEKRYVLVDSGEITIGVIPILPFITGRRNGRTFKIFPPMKSALDLQAELYQQESGLKYAKVLTAYPMLSGNGVKPQMEANGKTPKKLAVGPKRVLYGGVSPDGKPGSWSYVEPNAASLKFLAEDVKDTILQLRELGRQPLTAQSGNLTVITTKVAAGKARSAVGAWGLNLKNLLENALVLTNMYFEIAEEQYSPEVNVYDDYDDVDEQAEDLNALTTMREKGDLSRETLWSEMKRRGVLSPEFDKDEEIDRIFSEVPSDGDEETDDDTEDKKPVRKPAPTNPDA